LHPAFLRSQFGRHLPHPRCRMQDASSHGQTQHRIHLDHPRLHRLAHRGQSRLQTARVSTDMLGKLLRRVPANRGPSTALSRRRPSTLSCNPKPAEYPSPCTLSFRCSKSRGVSRGAYVCRAASSSSWVSGRDDETPASMSCCFLRVNDIRGPMPEPGRHPIFFSMTAPGLEEVEGRRADSSLAARELWTNS
jgi:hypothetical protein